MADAIAGTLFEQGVEQGEARARRADVLKLLQSQFGDIPESLVTQINAMQNPAELDTLFDAVLDAETIDDIHLQNGTPDNPGFDRCAYLAW